MPMFYLDNKRQKGASYLIHRSHCLFRQSKSHELGEFSWASHALKSAARLKLNTRRCELCCPIPPIKRKKSRSTRFTKLLKKLGRERS